MIVPDFSQDWTEELRLSTPYLQQYKERSTSLLEIGIFEGRSAIWFFREVLVHPSSHYTGIDDWWSHLTSDHSPERGLLLRPENIDALQWYNDVRTRAMQYFANIPTDKWTIIEKPSSQALYDLNLEKKQFNIVYIDGDQHFGAYLLDSLLSWPLVKDILLWGRVFPGRETNVAIRRFLELIPGEYEVIFYPDGRYHSQFAIKKRVGVPSQFVQPCGFITQNVIQPLRYVF